MKIFRDEVYDTGITIAEEDGKMVLSFEGGAMTMPSCSDETAVVAALVTVAKTQMSLAKIRDNDNVLIISEGIEGLAALAVLKGREVKVFYACSDKRYASAAAENGATVYESFDELADKIRPETDGEGPNVVLDYGDIGEHLSKLINEILSQAGRVVLCRRNTQNGSYQMRMGSYKELDMYGLDWCEMAEELNECEIEASENLTQFVVLE